MKWNERGRGSLARGGGRIKSYVIGNAICGAHNVAFMRWCTHRRAWAALCGRRVIKASAQTDKRLSRPTLFITVAARVWCKGVETNLRVPRPRFNCSPRYFRGVPHNWCDTPSTDSRLILTGHAYILRQRSTENRVNIYRISYIWSSEVLEILRVLYERKIWKICVDGVVELS